MGSGCVDDKIPESLGISHDREIDMSYGSSGKAFETKLNVLLGRLLSRELGFKAVSEYISHGDKPDIIIYVNGVRIVLDGSYSRINAENIVKRRIQEGLGDLGIAVFYKEHFSQNLSDLELERRLKNSNFEVKLIAPEDTSGTLLEYFSHQEITKATGWMEAKVQDLISIINEAIQFLVSEQDIEETIKEIEQKINSFVSSAKSVDSTKKMARRLYDVFYKLYGLSVGNYEEIDELIYAKAALTILLSTILYQSVRTEIGLSSISDLCRKYGYRLGLRKGFEEMLKVDYEPIYNLAIQVVENLSDGMSLALKNIVELAEKCSSKRTLLKRDFSGKVYHRIVGDWAVRKNFATYFTTIPAAYLLAYLAVFTRTGIFEEFRPVKIGDLACGSGTLLTATYSALKDLYVYSKFKKGEGIDFKEFHKMMLEESLWGIDALRYAVQIASTNLVFQDPATQVSHMNMFTVPLGVENGRVTLGSLEFIKGRSLPSIAMYFAEKPYLKFIESAEVASITGGKVPSELPQFDFIIMNPPFTRATGRGGKKGGGLFGFIPDESTRQTILKEYEKLRERVRQKLQALAPPCIEKELCNIGQAGEGLLFLYLASELVKEGGKIAFVLPKSLLTGISWFLARYLLLKRFHLEHIVVSYDAKNGYNFSESTSLSEALIVARRRNSPEKDENTIITILLRKPTTSLEARALAFKILSSKGSEYIEVNGSKAYIDRVSRDKLIERIVNWGSLLAFPDPSLTKIANEVIDGRIFNTKLPMIRLGEMVTSGIVTIGIDGHRFNDIFQVVKGQPPGSYPAVYGGEEEIRSRMLISPNARVLPRKIQTGKKIFENFSGNLLVPARIQVSTAHAISLYCDEPVLSNIFYALKFKTYENATSRLKALCLWFNTTWGVLSVLANRCETKGGWIQHRVNHWKLQPVLDVTKLNEDEVEKLATIFDRYCRKDLRRLPQQFDPDNIDPIRKRIDEEFLEALGVKPEGESLRDLYKLVYQNLSIWLGKNFTQEKNVE